MISIKDVLTQATQQLETANIPSARLEARLLFGHCYNLSQEDIIRQLLDPILEDLASFWILVGKRCQSIPLAHLTGKKEFWDLSFTVSPDVLIPRSDSGTLIEAVQQHWQPSPGQDQPFFLDLGTGSGCLLLTLLHLYPQAYGLGIDYSKTVCDVAQKNAEDLEIHTRCHFVVSSWEQCLSPHLSFDVIISNPPYLYFDDPFVSKEVRQFEPSLALWGGKDGLDIYKHFAKSLHNFVKPHGIIVLEIGYDQAETVSNLFLDTSLKIIDMRKDLAGHNRCLVLQTQA